MLKLCMFSLLVMLVKTEVDIEQFYGKWMLIKMYPKGMVSMSTKCKEYAISKSNNTEQCQCGNRNNVPLLEVKNLVDDIKTVYLVLTVNSSAEVESTLQINCTCDGQLEGQIIFRPMNENYFIMYQHYFGPGYLKETNWAFILVKKIPSATELKAMYKYDDLSDRQGSALCLPALYDN